MFAYLATRDGDIRAAKPYGTNRRSGQKRRQSEGWILNQERRNRHERRLDADWRYAVIRRSMAVIRCFVEPG